MVTEQFLHFVGMIRERLPSFGDEILTLLFNFAFSSLNDALFVACLLRFYLCRLSLPISVFSYSVLSRAESCSPDGLNHALIYRVHTMGFSFPDRKWPDALKTVARCLDNPRMKLQFSVCKGVKVSTCSAILLEPRMRLLSLEFFFVTIRFPLARRF